MSLLHKVCTMILFIAQNRKSIAEFRHKFPASGNTVRLLKHFKMLLQNYFKLKATLLSLFCIWISFPLLAVFIFLHIFHLKLDAFLICDFIHIFISSSGSLFTALFLYFLTSVSRTVWSETTPALNCATIGVNVTTYTPIFFTDTLNQGWPISTHRRAT